MAYGEKVIECARELFFTLDESGNRLHSLQDIANEIGRKFHKKITKNTICVWAKNGGWELTIKQGKNIGAIKAITRNIQGEEKVVAAIASDTAERRKSAKGILDNSRFLLGAILEGQVKMLKDGGESEIDPRILITAIKTEEENIMRLDGIDTGGDNKVKELVDAIRGL